MGQGMKVKSLKVSFLLLNSEFSFNNQSISTKPLEEDLKILPEGCVSQDFDLGSRYFFM